jgi:hypothetical protein
MRCLGEPLLGMTSSTSTGKGMTFLPRITVRHSPVMPGFTNFRGIIGSIGIKGLNLPLSAALSTEHAASEEKISEQISNNRKQKADVFL